MTEIDLINTNPKEVRRDEELMRLFIEIYKTHFFYKPTCTGCTFSADFQRLKNKILKTKDMKPRKKTHKVKREHHNTIFRYKDLGGKIKRRYGRDFDDEFALGFLEHSKLKEKEAIFEDMEWVKDAKNEAEAPESAEMKVVKDQPKKQAAKKAKKQSGTKKK